MNFPWNSCLGSVFWNSFVVLNKLIYSFVELFQSVTQQVTIEIPKWNSIKTDFVSRKIDLDDIVALRKAKASAKSKNVSWLNESRAESSVSFVLIFLFLLRSWLRCFSGNSTLTLGRVETIQFDTVRSLSKHNERKTNSVACKRAIFVITTNCLCFHKTDNQSDARFQSFLFSLRWNFPCFFSISFGWKSIFEAQINQIKNEKKKCFVFRSLDEWIYQFENWFSKMRPESHKFNCNSETKSAETKPKMIANESDERKGERKEELTRQTNHAVNDFRSSKTIKQDDKRRKHWTMQEWEKENISDHENNNVSVQLKAKKRAKQNPNEPKIWKMPNKPFVVR